jgi:4-amino-4-deoxychorismate lyase
MRTESRNLELRTVLDVVERQTYLRYVPSDVIESSSTSSSSPESYVKKKVWPDPATQSAGETDVTTVVTLHSRLGQRLIKRTNPNGDIATQPARTNFLLSWSQARLQRSIEAIGLSRASKSQPNAMEGMKVVLERLREGGLVEVLEGMRRDREARS